MPGKKTRIIITVLTSCILMFSLFGCDELGTPGSGTDDGTLSALSLSAGTLSPAFDSATTEYSVTLQTGTTSIIITPTASDSSVLIEVDGTVVDSGTASGAVTLAEGLNTVSIEVSSADGTVLKTYTLKIIVGGFKISGTLTNTSGDDFTGKAFLVGVTNDFESGDAAILFDGIWASGSTQSFELSNVPPGSYYLYTLIDGNEDGSFDAEYPDYGGLYGWAFDSLGSFMETGMPPGDPNLTVIDKDLVAGIDDIQQIPAVEDGTITVNLINAEAHVGKNFGFAVFEDDSLEPGTYVAANYDTIAENGTAGDVAYIYEIDEQQEILVPTENVFIASGGSYYEIHVMIDMNGNGETDDGDYVGILEDVYINGNTSITADYNDMTIYSEPVGTDGSITVSLTGGMDADGDMVIFVVYDEGDSPGTDNYLASGGFAIGSDGTGSGLAMEKDAPDTVFAGIEGTSYTVIIFVDEDGGYNIDPGELVGTYEATIDGATTVPVAYGDLNPYSEPAQ